MVDIRTLAVLAVSITLLPAWDCAPDVGTSSTDDGGTPLLDSGVAEMDSGVAEMDAALPGVDAGSLPDGGVSADSSVPLVDAGAVDAHVVTTGDFTVTTSDNDRGFHYYEKQMSMAVDSAGTAFFAYLALGIEESVHFNTFSSGTWTLHELPAPSGTEGDDYYFRYATVVLDAAEQPIVLYVANGPGWDGFRCRLNAATRAGDSWEITEVTRQPFDCGDGSSIGSAGETRAIDAQRDAAGNIHVVADMHGAVYAQRVGSTWTTTRITTAEGDESTHPALGLNQAGVVYVAAGGYVPGSFDWLNKLFRKEGSGFVEVSLPALIANAPQRVGLALAVDTSGRPHMMLADDEAMRYAFRDGETWTTEVAPSSIPDSYRIGRTTDTPAMLVNAGGHIVAAFVQALDDDPDPSPPRTGVGGVRLMERTPSGAWSVQTIQVTMDDLLHHPNVALDGAGHVHVGWSGDGPTHAVR
ncbi:MAG: hypothetical protein IPK60_17310 [Sandaracinaceae bacterium]|nr:hypothetical protein [Sandaracinaceae bacterium]